MIKKIKNKHTWCMNFIHYFEEVQFKNLVFFVEEISLTDESKF